jgi:hypothetical protein
MSRPADRSLVPALTAIDREVPNPAVKAATAELKRLRNAAQKLRAALGRTLLLDAAQPMLVPISRRTRRNRQPKQRSYHPTQRTS